MKRLFIFMTLCGLAPAAIFAAATESTVVKTYEVASDNKDKAYADLTEDLKVNDGVDLTKATKGYYLQGVTVKCNSSGKVETSGVNAVNPVCTNGNKNPYINAVSSAKNTELTAGASCDVNHAVDSKGAFIYATTNFLYDCDYIKNSENKKEEYVANVNTTTVSNAVTTTTVTSPETGLEDYIPYLLGGAIILFIATSILDKKNVFKNI